VGVVPIVLYLSGLFDVERRGGDTIYKHQHPPSAQSKQADKRRNPPARNQ
jgi:hypothetical protein